jgi:hypothetical protein
VKTPGTTRNDDRCNTGLNDLFDLCRSFIATKKRMGAAETYTGLLGGNFFESLDVERRPDIAPATEEDRDIFLLVSHDENSRNSGEL